MGDSRVWEGRGNTRVTGRARKKRLPPFLGSYKKIRDREGTSEKRKKTGKGEFRGLQRGKIDGPWRKTSGEKSSLGS